MVYTVQYIHIIPSSIARRMYSRFEYIQYTEGVVGGCASLPSLLLLVCSQALGRSMCAHTKVYIQSFQLVFLVHCTLHAQSLMRL